MQYWPCMNLKLRWQHWSSCGQGHPCQPVSARPQLVPAKQRQPSLTDVKMKNMKTVYLIIIKICNFFLCTSPPSTFPFLVIAVIFIKYAICPTNVYSALVNNLHCNSGLRCFSSLAVVCTGVCHREIQIWKLTGEI